MNAVLETIYSELDYKKVADFPQEYSRYFPPSIINVFSLSIALDNILEGKKNAGVV